MYRNTSPYRDAVSPIARLVAARGFAFCLRVIPRNFRNVEEFARFVWDILQRRLLIWGAAVPGSLAYLEQVL